MDADGCVQAEAAAGLPGEHVGDGVVVGRFARALSPADYDAVVEELNSDRFAERSPAEAWATLLDEGRYLASERTMYWIVAERREVRERRNQLVHPVYQKPELMAERPNQLWNWDITKRLGPAKWTYY